MSRSRKHKPIIGIAGSSEKDDKKSWHGAYRAACDSYVRTALIDDKLSPPLTNEHSNPWSMSKDGKVYSTSRVNKKDCDPILIKRHRRIRDAKRNKEHQESDS